MAMVSQPMVIGYEEWRDTWVTHCMDRRITNRNPGDCVESVSTVASQGSVPNVSLSIPQLFPGHPLTVQATYDTRTLAPGDYVFAFDWTATCL